MADIRQTTVILDDFERADEYPLSGGGNWNWTDTGPFFPLRLKHSGSNGVVTHPASTQTGNNSNGRFADSYWVHPFSTSDGIVEVWATPLGGNASGIAWALGLWKQPGGTWQVDGYRFRQEVSTGGGSTRIYQYTNGVRTAIASGPNGSTGGFPNMRWLFRIHPSGLLEAYFSTDSGANWTLKVSASGSVGDGTFYLGLGVTDNSYSSLPAWDNMGGGVRAPKRTQIYRWLPAYERNPT